jgi:hypothetical protein
MEKLCPITGDQHCKCKTNLAITPLGRALLVDTKAAVRKVFTDHLVFTNWVIIESVPELTDSQPIIVNRLLENPKDIAVLLRSIIGNELARKVEELFTVHLKLAAAALTPLREGNSKALNKAVTEFLEQGKELAAGLHALNPEKLSLAYADKLVSEHNQFVVDIATTRQKGEAKKHVNLYDEYFHHGLGFADAIYETLTA